MARSTDREVRQVLVITFLLNLAVCGAKLVYGFLTRSLSLQADGFHSLLDSSSNIVAMIGIILAAKPPDIEHPYGHRKIETLAALGISFLLFATGYEIVTSVVERIKHPAIPQVHYLSFVIMSVTVAINFWVSTYEMKKGLSLKSDLLTADSLHTRSDIFVSLSVIGSFVAVLLNAVFLDAVIAGGIILFIVYAAFRIMHRSLNVLLDAQPMDPAGIEQIVKAIPGILLCHKIRTRGTSNGVFVDFHIHVNPLMTLEDAHSLTHRVIREVKEKYPEIVDVVIHTEPAYLTKAHKIGN
ncbi:MAG: cation transporter [Deltaproteobacteria bacterium]|nr:cation transporter [Deltaproteobacteria bacterium]